MFGGKCVHKDSTSREKPIMSEEIHVDRQLDAKGMLCPMPVISVKRAIKDLQRGQVLVVSATDKGACRDIPAWAEQTGHALLEQTEENGVYTFYIEKAGWEEEERGEDVISQTPPTRYRLRIIYCRRRCRSFSD